MKHTLKELLKTFSFNVFIQHLKYFRKRSVFLFHVSEFFECSPWQFSNEWQFCWQDELSNNFRIYMKLFSFISHNIQVFFSKTFSNSFLFSTSKVCSETLGFQFIMTKFKYFSNHQFFMSKKQHLFWYHCGYEMLNFSICFKKR